MGDGFVFVDLIFHIRRKNNKPTLFMAGASTLIISNDDLTYRNLELGAGSGGFGPKYYPLCYSVDKDPKHSLNGQASKVYFTCDAHNLPWSENRFDTIILANPYQYGFRNKNTAWTLLKELGRVLVDQGKILVLGTGKNPWINMVDILISRITDTENLTFACRKETIDCDTDYPGHVFNLSDVGTLKPNIKFTIDVTKQ